MVHAQPALEHGAHAQDLGQLAVAAAQARERAVAEQVHLRLLGRGGQVQAAQVVRQLVHPLLAEAEAHHRQQRPANVQDV